MTKNTLKISRLLLILFALVPLQVLVARADSNVASSWMISRIKMFDPNNGWCLSNFNNHASIMVTTDGAKHWVDVSPKSFLPPFDNDDPDQQRIGTSFLSSHTAWITRVVPNNGAQVIYVYHTTNSGKVWTVAHFPVSRKSGSQHVFSCNASISFVDPRRGFVLATLNTSQRELQYKTIYASSDGGRTWGTVAGDQQPIIKKTTSLPSLGYVTGFQFSDSMRGWVTTRFNGDQNASLYKSNDGGKNWSLCLFQHPFSVQAVSYTANFLPSFFGEKRNVGVAAISFLNAQGNSTLATYLTLDSGEKWSTPTSSSLGRLGVAPIDNFCDSSHGWVWDSDGFNLYSTSNAGHQWKLIRSSRICQQFYSPVQLDFLTPIQGWAVVRPVISLVKIKNSYLVTGKWVSFLYRTNNGGKTWAKQEFTSQ